VKYTTFILLAVVHSAVQGVQGRVVGPYSLWDSVSGLPYAGESGPFRPLIFLGPVRYGVARCGVSSDPN